MTPFAQLITGLQGSWCPIDHNYFMWSLNRQLKFTFRLRSRYGAVYMPLSLHIYISVPSDLPRRRPPCALCVSSLTYRNNVGFRQSRWYGTSSKELTQWRRVTMMKWRRETCGSASPPRGVIHCLVSSPLSLVYHSVAMCPVQYRTMYLTTGDTMFS